MSTASPARVVMIGIDAASPSLVARWMADGSLPNLAAVMARGTSAELLGVEGFYVGSTWPSMYTGTNPARHGVHYLLQLVPGTYRLHRVAEAEFVRQPAFWEALGAAGRRVAILDVPLTRLDPSIRGMQVVEWGGHDSIYGFRTAPAALADELLSHHGAHPLRGACDRTGRTREAFAEFIATLEAGVRHKAAWTRELLGRGGWDLFMQVFTESHCAGHQCWHLHDAAHPAHDAEFARVHGDPVRRVYQAIDAAIGEIVHDAGDAAVVVFAAHGMSHRFGAQFLLRDILVRLGVTVEEFAPAESRSGVLARTMRGGWTRLPERLKQPVRTLRRLAARPGTRAAGIPSLRVDVNHSRCFPLNNGLAVGGIRLNLVGREPSGVLQPGPEADAFCTELRARLLEIGNAETGRPLVARVTRTAEMYVGEHLDALPDLLVEWNDADPLGSSALGPAGAGRVRARSDAIGVIEGTNDYARTGEHRPNGWLIAAGPGIPHRRLERPVSLLDVAPTAAAMLGVPLPGVDGRPIAELSGSRI
ncbi:MAG TPA: alkaline phosphatase family protein [Gemmatimonadaceae bacterium]|nr:alkaline phosphatase family protein [Gemmatimonadaceae bacterium]